MSFKFGLPFFYMLKSDIFIFIFLIIPDRMTVRERTTPNILTRQSNCKAIFKQCSKSHSFGHSPIKTLATFQHLCFSSYYALQLLINGKILGHRCNNRANALQIFIRYRCFPAALIAFSYLQTTPRSSKIICFIWLIIINSIK